MRINKNVPFLSDEEKQYLAGLAWYTYVYGVGLIFFPDGGSWDCTNTVEAKQYLDDLKIPEKP